MDGETETLIEVFIHSEAYNKLAYYIVQEPFSIGLNIGSRISWQESCLDLAHSSYLPDILMTTEFRRSGS